LSLLRTSHSGIRYYSAQAVPQVREQRRPMRVRTRIHHAIPTAMLIMLSMITIAMQRSANRASASPRGTKNAPKGSAPRSAVQGGIVA
jgi:hypothetical protein